MNDFDKREAEIRSEIAVASVEGVPLASDTDAIEEHMYKEDCLNIDLEILSIERDKENTQYTDNINALNKEYNRLGTGSDGAGGFIIPTDIDGSVGCVNISKGQSVEKGDFIMSVVNPSDDVYRVMMSSIGMNSKEGVAPALGSRVSITYGDSGKKFETMCIGINGDSLKHYLFTDNGRQYMTYSAPYHSGSVGQFFIRIEADDVDIGEDESENVSVEFCVKKLNRVIVLPGRAVYQEIDEFSNKTKSYVWKSEGGMVVKEYVKTIETNEGSVIVISGVDVGDKILVE